MRICCFITRCYALLRNSSVENMQKSKSPCLRNVKLVVAIQVVTHSYFSSAKLDHPLAVNRGRLIWSRSQEAVAAFGNPKYFTDRYISSNKPGVMIKLPNFDVLFEVGIILLKNFVHWKLSKYKLFAFQSIRFAQQSHSISRLFVRTYATSHPLQSRRSIMRTLLA